MASKNLNMNNIGTLKFVVRILTTYLILVMMIPSLHAVIPFKATMHKRQTGSSCTVPLGTKMVHSARHCGQLCSQTYNCKAFNVIRVQQEAPGLQCELFSHSDPDNQVDDDNAVFWELNYCHGHQCKNGGGCRIENEGYKCDCAEGYTGQYCETEIDECASGPCENAGVCTDVVAGFTCACVSGWEGITCQTNINECGSNPCINGGTCRDGVGRYTCACKAGYEGARCQTNINECVSNPCYNGGTCRDGVARYTCACKAGYEGTRCQTNINECASNPCSNRGACRDALARYTCECYAGYEGTRCQTNINECASNPCKNGATCRDAINSYTCVCRAGYIWPNCGGVIGCKTTTRGTEYTGQLAVTASGRTCQRWDSQVPHGHSQSVPENYPGYLVAYCRNPFTDLMPEKPWCYTTDTNVMREYCNVPYC